MSNENLENSHETEKSTPFDEEFGMKESDYLKTLERGINVIKSFQHAPHLTISESAKICGLSRPVTRRVLLTLQKLGYATSRDGKFSLTPRMLSLGYSYLFSLNIWETATPSLEALSEKIQESSSLCKLDDTEVVYVARVPVNKIMSHSLAIGTRLPAYATSMGKVLLAYSTNEQIDRYFQKAELKPFTDKTIIEEEKIREELKNIRQNGWAFSRDQLEIGLMSIAAPVRDVRGEVVAAVNCSTHSGRSSREKVEKEFLPLLLEAAESISKSIDFEIF